MPKRLGLRYSKGEGVTQDSKNAYIWLSIAIENGYSKAAKNRDEISSTLTPKELEEAKLEIAELQKKIEANKKKN